MKNLQTYYGKELREYVDQLWSTSWVRNSRVVRTRMLEPLLKRPITFFDPTDPALEWSHFTSWMGAIAHRTYENPLIQDLYYLHEFMHAATLPYQSYSSSTTFAEWFRTMTLNEAQASLISEAYIYLENPEMRSESFDFEIWVDRFLGEAEGANHVPDFMNTPAYGFSPGPDSYDLERLFQARVQAMTSPLPFDLCALQIHHYAKQNLQWANVWANSWREVQIEMQQYHNSFLEYPRASIHQHEKWLLQEGDIRFVHEAKQFQKVMLTNKERLGNEMFSR
jgi:hypothetical protein